MPEIPRPPIPAGVGLPSISPQMAGAPYAAVGHAADEANKLALYTEDAFIRVQKAEDHVQMLEAQNEVQADKDSLLQSFKERGDYRNFSKDMESAKAQLNKKYQEKYGSNPRVMRLLQPHLEGEIQDASRAVEGRRLQLMTDQNTTELNQVRDITQRKMAETEDPAEKLKLSSQFYEAVNASKESGLLTAQQAYQMTVGFDLDAEKTEIILGAKSDDVRDLVRIQDKIANKENYPNLRGHSPEWLANTEEMVKSKIDRINEKAALAADHLATNTFVDNILDQSTAADGTVDFDHAKKLMNDKDLQAKSGMNDPNGKLDLTRWEKSRTALRALEADYKADQKEASDKKYDEATKLILGKKFSTARDLIASSGFPAEHREALSNWIKSLTKEGAEPSTKDSLAEYARLSDIVDSSDDPQDAVQQIVKSRGLTVAHAEKLIDRARAVQGTEVKDSVSRSDKLINDMLAPSETLAQQVEALLTQDPKSLSSHQTELVRQTTNKKAVAGEAKEALHDWVAEQRRLHASGKRKAITSAEIWEYASQLAALKVEPLDKQIESIRNLEAARKGEAPVSHPLHGMKAGRYQVNGKIVRWDGKREL
jgi:hypothetical protein